MSTDLQQAAASQPPHWLQAPLGAWQILTRPALWLSGRHAIQLGDGFGNPAQRQRIERRIAFWRSLCGCQLAALGFLVAIAWQAWGHQAVQPLDGWVIARWLGVALLTALVVKLLALALARMAAAMELWWPRRAGLAAESTDFVRPT